MSQTVTEPENKNVHPKRILDAAETLSAGSFEQTSLRQITQEANVGLGQLSLWFKKGLDSAVVARYMNVFMPALEAELKQLDKRPSIDSLAVFESFKAPLVSLTQVHACPSTFCACSDLRILRLRVTFVVTPNRPSVMCCNTCWRCCTSQPKLTEQDMFWRLTLCWVQPCLLGVWTSTD